MSASVGHLRGRKTYWEERSYTVLGGKLVCWEASYVCWEPS